MFGFGKKKEAPEAPSDQNQVTDLPSQEEVHKDLDNLATERTARQIADEAAQTAEKEKAYQEGLGSLNENSEQGANSETAQAAGGVAVKEAAPENTVPSQQEVK